MTNEKRPAQPSHALLSHAAPAEFRTELSRVWGKRRLDLILDARNPEALVQSLPADEVYFTIREIGLADAAPLAALASAEQFRVFLDLDCWRDGECDPHKVLPWLRAARSGSNDSPREEARWRRKLATLDPEILELILRATVVLHDLERDPDPPLESDRFMNTPEGKYLLEFQVEGVDYLAVRNLIDDFLAEDPFKTVRLLEAVRWEFPSELQESALRWRTGRLADLGYPSLEEALSYYSRPPSKVERPAGLPERPAGFFLSTIQRGTLLSRAADQLPPEPRDRFEMELVTTANAVLVADAVDPGDVPAVRSAFETALATLELGMEVLSGGDQDRALGVLSSAPLKRIFQHGFGRALELRWRAEKIFGAGGAGTNRAPLLDPPLGEAMVALVRRRPLYFPGVDAPRSDWGSLAAAAFEARAFLSAAEIDQTAAALEQADELAALARKLGWSAPDEGQPFVPRLSSLFLTALANERLGRPFAPTPLAPADLPAAAQALTKIDHPSLAAEGAAGALLLEMARDRAEELAPILAGATPQPGQVTALLVNWPG
jgi:hypothetical protein